MKVSSLIGRFHRLVVCKESHNFKTYDLYICDKCSDSANVEYNLYIFEFKNFVRGFLNSAVRDERW